MTHSSPSRSARVRSAAKSDPPAGSENSWHQTSSPLANGGRYRALSSSRAQAMSVGAIMPCPIRKKFAGKSYWDSSCRQMTSSIGEAPRPPNSGAQPMQAQPASYFCFCHCLACSSGVSARKASSLGALSASHVAASSRKRASSGVSLKSISLLLHAATSCSAKAATSLSCQTASLPIAKLSSFARR